MNLFPQSANAVFPSAKPALVTATSRYSHFDFVRRHKHILNAVNILHVSTSTLRIKCGRQILTKNIGHVCKKAVWTVSSMRPSLFSDETRRKLVLGSRRIG
jgi:hypothetical protein